MDRDVTELIDILEKSIKKNGDKPLTLSHLLNILKMVQRKKDKEEENLDLIQAEFDSWGDS